MITKRLEARLTGSPRRKHGMKVQPWLDNLSVGSRVLVDPVWLGVDGELDPVNGEIVVIDPDSGESSCILSLIVRVIAPIRLINHLSIDYTRQQVRADGDEFPFHLAGGPIEICGDEGVSIAYLPVLCNSVSIVSADEED